LFQARRFVKPLCSAPQFLHEAFTRSNPGNRSDSTEAGVGFSGFFSNIIMPTL
jgi:hypothetical protein